MNKIGKRKTLEFIENELKDKGLYMIDNKEYANTKSKISLIDNMGYKYITTIDYMRNITNLDKFSTNNPNTVTNIKLYLKINNYKNKLISTEYINSADKLEFTCEYCGNTYLISFLDLKNKGRTKCKICSGGYKRNKKTITEVVDKLNEYNLILIDKSEYSNSASKLMVKDIEGYKYEISLGEFIQYNKNLDRFSIYNPNTIENIRLYLKLNNYKNELLSLKYENSDSKLSFTCGDCGEPYHVTFKHFRNANQLRCKVCSKNQSKYESATEKYLIENKIKHKKEYRFADCKDNKCLPFDFVIFDNEDNLLSVIECDGHFHFNPIEFKGSSRSAIDRFEMTKYHDDIKNNYCKKNKINLLRIPYWDFDNNNYIEILNNKL